MKNILAVSILLTLISGNALAGSEFARCIKEVKALKTKEAADCSGLRYMFNPSGCFVARKALQEYSGKCAKIGAVEQVDFSAQAGIPEKKSAPAASVSKAASTGNAGTAGSVAAVSTVERGTMKRPEAEVPQQESAVEQLKEENARLKAEISRLKSENEQLRNTVHQ